MLSALPDVILVVSSDGRIELAAGRCEGMLGYRSDELVGSSVEMLVPEHARARHEELRTSYTRNPLVRPMGRGGLRLDARRKDGAEVPVDIALSPVTHNGATHVIATIRDDSLRRQAEAKLAESDARFRIATQIARLLVWDRDIGTDVIHVSAGQAPWLFGDVDGDLELPYAEFRALIHHDDLEIFDVGVAFRLEGNEDEFEFRIRAADGSYHWVVSRGTLVRGEDGRLLRAVGAWLDTTALKEGGSGSLPGPGKRRLSSSSAISRSRESTTNG